MVKYLNTDLDFLRKLSDSDRNNLHKKLLDISDSSSEDLLKNKSYMSVIDNTCICTFHSLQNDKKLKGSGNIPNLGRSIKKNNILMCSKYEYIITKVPRELSSNFITKLKKLRENIHNSGYMEDYISNVYNGRTSEHPGTVKMNQLEIDFNLANEIVDINQYIAHSYEYSFQITEKNIDENYVQITLNINEIENLKGLLDFISYRWPGNESLSDMDFFDGNSSTESDIRLMNIITEIKSSILKIVSKTHCD